MQKYILEEELVYTNNTPILIAVMAVIVILIAVVVFFIVKNAKQKRQENEKSQKRKEKEEEVEDLKLTVEKEKLKQELDNITAPKFVYCKYCGTKNDADAKHCIKCGVGFDDK